MHNGKRDNLSHLGPRISGQVPHFHISRISRRMWLYLALDRFALGAHQIVV